MVDHRLVAHFIDVLLQRGEFLAELDMIFLVHGALVPAPDRPEFVDEALRLLRELLRFLVLERDDNLPSCTPALRYSRGTTSMKRASNRCRRVTSAGERRLGSVASTFSRQAATAVAADVAS